MCKGKGMTMNAMIPRVLNPFEHFWAMNVNLAKQQNVSLR